MSATKRFLGLLAVLMLVSACFAECPEFTYDEDDEESGPKVWGSLCPEYAKCFTGENQSPVDIDTRNIREPEESTADFSYRVAKEPTVSNKNSIITVTNSDDLSSFMFFSEELTNIYRLKTMQVHTPSEHTIDGDSFEAEIQFIHEADDGSVAIVSYLVESGDECDFLADFVEDLPDKDDSTTVERVVPITPTSSIFFRYTGSLTSPPCTENVEWFIQEDPIECSSRQIRDIRDAAGRNARPVADLKDRVVYRVDISSATVLSSGLFVALLFCLSLLF